MSILDDETLKTERAKIENSTTNKPISINVDTDKKESVHYNSIGNQTLTHPNQLTIRSWNDTINILRIQANDLTQYIKALNSEIYNGTEGWLSKVIDTVNTHNVLILHTLDKLNTLATNATIEELKTKIETDDAAIISGTNSSGTSLYGLKQTKLDTSVFTAYTNSMSTTLSDLGTSIDNKVSKLEGSGYTSNFVLTEKISDNSIYGSPLTSTPIKAYGWIPIFDNSGYLHSHTLDTADIISNTKDLNGNDPYVLVNADTIQQLCATLTEGYSFTRAAIVGAKLTSGTDTKDKTTIDGAIITNSSFDTTTFTSSTLQSSSKTGNTKIVGTVDYYPNGVNNDRDSIATESSVNALKDTIDKIPNTYKTTESFNEDIATRDAYWTTFIKSLNLTVDNSNGIVTFWYTNPLNNKAITKQVDLPTEKIFDSLEIITVSGTEDDTYYYKTIGLKESEVNKIYFKIKVKDNTAQYYYAGDLTAAYSDYVEKVKEVYDKLVTYNDAGDLTGGLLYNIEQQSKDIERNEYNSNTILYNITEEDNDIVITENYTASGGRVGAFATMIDSYNTLMKYEGDENSTSLHTHWGKFNIAEGNKNSKADETGSRWARFKFLENKCNNLITNANINEGSSGDDLSESGSRWARYFYYEDQRNGKYQSAEGNNASQSDTTRWGRYNIAEGTSKSDPDSEGSRWARFNYDQNQRTTEYNNIKNSLSAQALLNLAIQTEGIYKENPDDPTEDGIPFSIDNTGEIVISYVETNETIENVSYDDEAGILTIEY